MSRNKRQALLLVLMIGLTGLALPLRALAGEQGQSAAKLYEQAAEAHNNGDIDGAFVLYDKAISLQKDFADALFNRGRIYLFRDQYALAEADFRAVIRLTPASEESEASGYLAWDLILQGKAKEALPFAKKAAAQEPQSYIWASIQAHALLLSGDESNARNHYLKTVRLIAGQNEYEALLKDFAIFIGQNWSNAACLRSKEWVEKLYANRAELHQADALAKQVEQLSEGGKSAEAVPLAQQVVELYKKLLGDTHPEYARSLNNLAVLFHATGDYPKSLEYMNQSLAIWQVSVGKNHPDYIQTLSNIAALHGKMGDHTQALPLFEQVLELRKTTSGENSPEYAQSLNNLAVLYDQMGNYAKALPLYLQALEIKKRTVGATHPEYAASLNDLASLYENMGDYAKALPLYQQALEVLKKSVGEEHPDYARSLNNLAGLYHKMGDTAGALKLQEQAAATDKRVLGENHPSYATDLNHLATLHQAKGDYSTALQLYKQALEIRKKTVGTNHPKYAVILNNLTTLSIEMGDYDTALVFSRQAQAINQRVLGAEHPESLTGLNNQAVIHSKRGDHASALPLFQQVLEIRRKTLGESHPDYANSLNNLAFAHGVLGHNREALALFLQAQQVVGKNMDNLFAVGTEQQKLAFVQAQNWGYFGVLSLIHNRFATDPQAVKAALDLVLARKGIVFDAQARQNEAIARSLDPETQQIWRDLTSRRTTLARLIQSGPQQMSSQKMSPQEYQSQINQLQVEIAALEGRLASKSSLMAQQFQQRQITSREVAARLGSDGVLVEFVRISDFDWDHGKDVSSHRYLGFVLHADGKIEMVDLGDADKLEAVVEGALKAVGNLGGSSSDQQVATAALNSVIWLPIAAAVGGSKSVVFSPDGVLNLVPFAAIAEQEGRYLIESRQISFVTSGRDLARADTGIPPESGLYLAANPLFDLETAPAAEKGGGSSASRSAGFSMKFGQLPGTGQEALVVPGYLRGNNQVVTGKAATEASVLAVKRPQVMHLATHGFFLADQPEMAADGMRGVELLSEPESGLAAAPRLPKGYENPLVRSGLAFAGANHASEAAGDRDGLLTALEVTGMDLHGTDLVTLSACETGRGEVKSGEGVFGLRRAFALAGTKNLIMSLWPVSDRVTAQQMAVLYREYGQHHSPARALRSAQIETISDLRQQKGWASPALWAPFIVQSNGAVLKP